MKSINPGMGVLKRGERYNVTLNPAPQNNTPKPPFLGISHDLWLTAAIVVSSILAGEFFVWRHQPDWTTRSAALLWALACLGSGSLLGLIFGIPRSASEVHLKPKHGDDHRLSANTNMEQISDWLTKLLVGAGLVELKSFPHYLHAAAQYVAAGMGASADPGAAPFAAALIIYFFVEGFLGGYLATRMFFQSAFRRSDETLE